MTTALHAYCDTHQHWMLQLIEELVRIESPSDDKAAVDRCGRFLSDRLGEMGGRVMHIQSAAAGDHLRASFGDGPRRLLLLGHFDTVWPIGQLAQMPLRHDGGRLYGPGVYDMKAGLAMSMLATRAVLQVAQPRGVQVVMLWTTDEEIGSRTSRALIEAEASQCEAVLVMEPALASGAVKTSRKGCGQYELTIRGVAAHAGVDPRKGVSAIRELARQILAVEALQDLDRGVSVNVGLVDGGSRANVVADFARAVVDVRAPTIADAERVDLAFQSLVAQLPGAQLTVAGGFNRPPMERTEGVARLFGMARDVAAEMGVDLAEGGTGGGSDGNFTAAMGVPTLDGLGALGDGAHALHEHVVVSSLVPRTALIAGLLAKLSA